MIDQIIQGDAYTELQKLPSESVDCCITSPPYWSLRNYNVEGQIGLEDTPDEYVSKLVNVFREVKRVLKASGTLWLNLGDCYAGSWGNYSPKSSCPKEGWTETRFDRRAYDDRTWRPPNSHRQAGLKTKDLVGLPWMVAFALRADGWWLRSDIIWHKPNPMPESVVDRPTKTHEYIFLLSKSEVYFYDSTAILEPFQTNPKENYPARAHVTGRGLQGAASARGNDRDKSGGFPPRKGSGNVERKLADGTDSRLNTHMGRGVPYQYEDHAGGRNKRTVWTVATHPYKGAHFATFPEKLVEPCIQAGTSEKGYCPACGKPWIRQVEKTFIPQQDVSIKKGVRGAEQQKPMDASNSWQGFPRGTTHTETSGWAPSCECGLPEKLVEPCINAGTSEKGYCSKCGKPCIRKMEKTSIPDASAKGSKFDFGKTGINGLGRVQPGERFLKVETGWLPSCQCTCDLIPGVVLDPFFGAGTVGVVAKKLGRHYIGIELNPDYIKMAKKRIGAIPARLDHWVEDKIEVSA